MKIAFIRPSMLGEPSKDAMMPLVFSIIKPLTPPDVDLVFYDERVENLPTQLDASIVAMTVETFSARRAYLLADRYRSEGKKVIMGGFHPTLMPKECLLHADGIVIGEAEDTWGQVVADLKDGTLKKSYVSGNHVDLSQIKYDYSVFQGKKYHKIGLVQFSRGCRFNCDFCSIHAFYKDNVRCKSIAAIVEELRSMQQRYIFFIDDNLFANETCVRELFKAMIPLKKKWFCQVSIDVASKPDLLHLMKKSGCMLVLIGFESLNAANLKQMGKRANLEAASYDQVIENIYAAGMMIYATFVVGYDYDTVESTEALVDFALRHKFAIANFNPLMPMPGTRLLKRLEEQERLAFSKWWLHPDYSYGGAMLEPRSMTKQELMESCMRARYKFNTYGNILRRMLHRKANGKNLENAALFLIANLVSRSEIYAKQGKPLGGK